MRISIRLFLFGVAALNPLMGAHARGSLVLTDLAGGNAYAMNASGQVVG